jgi:hypothetical protein
MADCTVLFPRPERKNGAFDARNRFGKAVFSGRFDAMSTFYTNLADRPAYASSIPLPRCLQGSILGSWLAVTHAGITPARLRSIAKPLPMAGLHAPLSTLRRPPRGVRRMTRGRCGSLD